MRELTMAPTFKTPTWRAEPLEDGRYRLLIRDGLQRRMVADILEENDVWTAFRMDEADNGRFCKVTMIPITKW